ncbi:dicarboxylate--CoA ligase PimA [Arthrobacter sp. TPD3018]|uniref:long-chain-fatty-acid--CoA ligase n=1 Tax=Bacteria TaxID=2 RepID=UPI000D51AC77|nr:MULTISPECIES: long-chain fatty acid--CoA ligase [Bacteria]PVE59963.1 dicarboxylate--CoA ligase PimA [Sphingomonas sp. TPD3009]PVE61479.1 dicarboxylate--CoA ligase PimA [Arthrobacter sp. TPD3018]PVE85604.1 dicarboxylate--CoA ligase PimA [Sphingomonas melonis]
MSDTATAGTTAQGAAPLAIKQGVPLPSRPRLLGDLLDHTVARFPGRPAIDFMGSVTSWGDLGNAVDRATAGLQALGVVKGTRVALCLPNTPYYPILFFATLKAGGIVVNVNPLYVERELAHLIHDSGAEIIATPDVAEIQARVLKVAGEAGMRHVITCPIADALPTIKKYAYKLVKRKEIGRAQRDARHLFFADLMAKRATPAPVAVAPDEVAVLQYTGGTTGVPKAAMLSHANIVANTDAMLVHVGGETPDQDRVLGVLPLFHVFALTNVLTFSTLVGAEMILLPRFEMKQLLATLKRTRPTYFPAVPTIYNALANLGEEQRPDLSAIKVCISGGAPLPIEVRHAFEANTGAKLVEGYGLSEASPIITCNPFDGVNKEGSAGLPFPGTTIEIRDREDPTRIMPKGEKGEICARGPQVMKGYWHKPAETDAAFADGALRTGDVGYLDDDGYLFIVDRIKDMILCGGYNVYPRVIEEALYEHPAVVEAVVIGVPDAHRGQAPKAFVVLSEPGSVTGADLRDFLRDKISKIELPREVEIRDTLPKTLIGKLSKKELVEEEMAKAAR